MTARFRTSVMAAALAGLVTLGSAPPAEAAFRLTLIDDASTVLDVDDDSTIDRDDDIPNQIRYRTATTTPFGGFSIDVSTVSNGPGSAILGYVTESTLVLSNVEGVTRTLTIVVEDDVDPTLYGFDQPAGPPV